MITLNGDLPLPLNAATLIGTAFVFMELWNKLCRTGVLTIQKFVTLLRLGVV
jgi:hypothetical protein